MSETTKAADQARKRGRPPGPVKKRKTTLWLEVGLYERFKNAAPCLGMHLAELINQQMQQAMAALEDAFNDGQPFPEVFRPEPLPKPRRRAPKRDKTPSVAQQRAARRRERIDRVSQEFFGEEAPPTPGLRLIV